MKKVLFPTLIIITLCACMLSQQGPAIDPGQLAAEEQAVYAVFFAGYSPDSTVVIQRSPASFADNLEAGDGTMEYLRKEMPGLSDALLRNFRERNQGTEPFDDSLQIGIDYYLLEADELHAIFDQDLNGGQDGWDLFYSRFPDSPGITELSRVGFDPGMKRAVVYVGNQSHWLAGAGVFYLLEKQAGRWEIIEQVMVWIS